MTFGCIIARAITTILILINYKQIQKVCEKIFGDEENVG